MNLRQRQVEIVCDNHYTVKILTRASVSELENVLNDFRKSEIFPLLYSTSRKVSLFRFELL